MPETNRHAGMISAGPVSTPEIQTKYKNDDNF
jgi:hypothetical protein